MQANAPQQLNAIYIGDALDYFFNNASMNLYDGDIAINLMDLFPMVKQRFALMNILSLILSIYELKSIESNWSTPAVGSDKS